MNILKNSNEIKIPYSYLKASIGFNLAAFRAGYHPKKTPIKDEKKKDNKMAFIEIVTGQPASDATRKAMAHPRIIPIIPPEALSRIDSIKN